jgi:hypothetical protein
VSLISVAMDAPQDVISTLSGKLGRMKGVSAKVAYSKLPETVGGAKQEAAEIERK